MMEIVDAQPVPLFGFDRLILDHAQPQAVLRDHLYAAWRNAACSLVGIYLISDTLDGRHHAGKADVAESIRRRWNAYPTNGHCGNVELGGLAPSTFRFSASRV